MDDALRERLCLQIESCECSLVTGLCMGNKYICISSYAVDLFAVPRYSMINCEERQISQGLYYV